VNRFQVFAVAAVAAFSIGTIPTAGAQGPVFASSGGGDQRIRCESDDGRERYCAVDAAGGVRLARTVSRAPCIEGQSWRWDRRGIYVRNGCRADFDVRGSDGWGGGGGWGGGNRYSEVVCAAPGDRETFCRAPNDGRVRLVREQGPGRCVEGESWRAEPGGIRVRRGCIGRFGIYVSGGWGGGSDGGWNDRPSGPFEVRCESRSGRWTTCPVDIDGPVELRRQDSHAACVRGWTWGTLSREAIWVSDGCRGRFVVNGRPSMRSNAEGNGGVPPGVRRSAGPDARFEGEPRDREERNDQR
jgi:hypothetical protein